jgi:hypothetical protein
MLHGTATARFSGPSDFWVIAPGGFRCGGTYDAITDTPTLVVPVTCSDGRKGEVAITRDKTKIAGTATGRLSDGTEARFVFGDRKFDQFYLPNQTTIVKEYIVPVPVPVAPKPSAPQATSPNKKEKEKKYDI